MPIDITQETLISLTQATAHIPRRRRGRKTAVSTLHRWATHGVRGIVLETLQVGGTRCTTLAALQRFFDGLSALDQNTAGRPAEDPTGDDSFQAADKELDNLWERRPR